jgi:hypothetical protein
LWCISLNVVESAKKGHHRHNSTRQALLTTTDTPLDDSDTQTEASTKTKRVHFLHRVRHKNIVTTTVAPSDDENHETESTTMNEILNEEETSTTTESSDTETSSTRRPSPHHRRNKTKKLKKHNISTNETYLSKEVWIEVYGSNLILDYITLYFMVPISLIGFLINWLCFFIISKASFNSTQLFNYLKVYVINSSLICLLSATHFISATKYFFEFTNTYEACAYGSNSYKYLLSVSYFYGSYLDIYISLERLSNFIPSFKIKIKNLSYLKLCLSLLIFSIVLNIVRVCSYSNNISRAIQTWKETN